MCSRPFDALFQPWVFQSNAEGGRVKEEWLMGKRS